MSCPYLDPNADLGLKAPFSPKPRKSLAFRSLQSHNTQLRTPCQSQGASGVSLAQYLHFPDGGTMAQRGVGLCSSAGLPFYEGAGQRREPAGLSLAMSPDKPSTAPSWGSLCVHLRARPPSLCQSQPTDILRSMYLSIFPHLSPTTGGSVRPVSCPQAWHNAGSQRRSRDAHWMDGDRERRQREKTQGREGGEAGRWWLSQSQMGTCSPPACASLHSCLGHLAGDHGVGERTKPLASAGLGSNPSRCP